MDTASLKKLASSLDDLEERIGEVKLTLKALKDTRDKVISEMRSTITGSPLFDKATGEVLA